MTYLLRQARRSVWTGEADVTPERRADAVASFGRRAEDTDGVSIFMIDDPGHVHLVLAAIACTKHETGKIDLLRVENDEISRFGASTNVEGTTPVARANPLHRTLDWDTGVLTQLVEYLLNEKRQSARHQPATVIAAVLALEPDDVTDGPDRDWVAKLRAEKTKPK